MAETSQASNTTSAQPTAIDTQHDRAADDCPLSAAIKAFEATTSRRRRLSFDDKDLEPRAIDPLFPAEAEHRRVSRTLDQVAALEAQYGARCPQGQALLEELSRVLERAAARRLGLA